MPEVLREQELSVGTDNARHHSERDQLPRELASFQLDETGIDRCRHPHLQVRVVIQERTGRGQSFASIPRLATQQAVVFGECRQQTSDRWRRCRRCRAHRCIAARAAANSAASASDDRCT